MSFRTIGPSWKGLRIGLVIAGIVGGIAAVFAWFQIQQESRIDQEDLNRRAVVLAHRVSDTVLTALGHSDAEAKKMLSGELEGYGRLKGFAVYRSNGRLVAASKGLAEFLPELESPITQALRSSTEVTQTTQTFEEFVHVMAVPVLDSEGSLKGVVAVLHDATHLEDRATNRLLRFGFWIMIITLLLTSLVASATWTAYDRPLRNLAEWMRRLRTGEVPEAPPVGLPVALLATESDRLAASFRAARAAGWEESRERVRDHKTWSRERLCAYALDCVRNGQLVIVSNREPYMHILRDGAPHVIVPAGGLVTALDPVLQACGGLWVAHGAGEADREAADEHGRLTVPPKNPRYTLRRVWLTREEEQGYYYGFANEGLWPLCHLAHERPMFRASDWEDYVKANRRFADAVLSEVSGSDAIVLVQDYQLALVPEMLKASRPDLRVGIFWHIPWPNPEAFRICPWRTEILQGMLGADVVGFHLQQYCNNFLDSVDRMVEARLDWDHFAVELRGRRVLVRPFPISIESWAQRGECSGAELEAELARIRDMHKLGDCKLVIGVERIDYTKGLAERFRAIARFLEQYPKYHGKVAFIVLGAPSRTHLRRYRDLIAELESLADEINWRFGTESWKPLRFLVGHHDAATVHSHMCLASVCIVSALHDGMNLVAKEYVSAKQNEDGVLILSEFAGAARELSEALIVNPYDTEQFAQAIQAALDMDPEERRDRMRRMRQTVEENNVFRWAATLLSDLTNTRPARSGHDPSASGVHRIPVGATNGN